MHIQELNKHFFMVTAEAPKPLTVYSQKENTSLKIINFGANNKYPQQLIDLLSESPIAGACVETHAKYLIGDGLYVDDETEFSKRLLRSIWTQDRWEQTCYSFATFEATGIQQKWNMNGKITDMIPCDYSTIRLGIPNDRNEVDYAMISSSWPLSTKNKLFNPVKIDLYQGAKSAAAADNFEDIEAFREWNGTINIIRRKRPGQLYYTNPKYATAEGWIYTDGQIQKFHAKNVDNSFAPGFIIYVPFDLDGVDEDGNSLKDNFKAEIKSRWLGADNAGDPAILYGSNKEATPQIIPFVSNANDKMFIAISDLIVDHICTAMQVPPLLANIQVSKGLNGTAQDIINEYDKYTSTVIKPDQNKILSEINDMIPYMEGYDGKTVLKVSNSRPLAYIDPSFKDDYTEEERRFSNGYGPKVVKEANNE